jgi:hypothetical protein
MQYCRQKVKFSNVILHDSEAANRLYCLLKTTRGEILNARGFANLSLSVNACLIVSEIHGQ